MIMTVRILLSVLALSLSVFVSRADKPFFSTERPASIVEVGVHAIVGATAVTENYSSQIPGVEKADSHPGLGLGAGARVSFVLRDYIALTTGLDMLWGHNKCTMTTVGDGTPNVNNIYLSNNYLYARAPVLMSFRLNLADRAQWILDAGVYFATGISGRQKADVYTTGVNDLGQLVTRCYRESWNYFRNDAGLIHTVHSFDFGLQLGTSFCFRGHYTAGVTFSYGLKDAAKPLGPLDKVSMHNIDWLGYIGYRF